MHQNTKGDTNDLTRRHFLKIAGISALAMSCTGIPDSKAERVSIVIDPGDPVAGTPPAQWAAKELEEALTLRGIAVNRVGQLSKAAAGDLCIVVAGSDSSLARQLLNEAETSVPAVPEALGLVPGKSAGKQVLLACGHDERGLVYALLELADRVHNAVQPQASLAIQKPIVEQPANLIRSLTRLFVSDIEDKPWYNDREMWPQYLSMLATQRYNRFVSFRVIHVPVI